MRSYVTPTLVFLDIDRTLIPVEDSFAYLCSVLKEAGYEALLASLEDAKRRVESATIPGTFSPYTWLEQELGTVRLHALLAAKRAPAYDLITDDSWRFMSKLKVASVPYLALSYAEHFEGQVWKVRSSGYSGGLLLTSSIDKGTVIPALMDEDSDTVSFRNLRTGEVSMAELPDLCLIDDKPAVFENWPGYGFCIRRRGGVERSLPKRVKYIRSLNELGMEEGRLVLAHTASDALVVPGHTQGDAMVPLRNANDAAMRIQSYILP